jgi:LDH2 family malate/lactate/ureidoglycolate dehydrogenase
MMLSSIRTGTVAVSRSAVLKTYLYGSVTCTARSSFSSQASAGVVQVPIDEARSVTAKALKMIGWDDDDAALQAEIMTAAELCGNNQGLVKMYNPVLMAPATGAAKPVVERDTSTSAVINGNQSPGMLAAVTAADLAVAKVKASEGPIAIVCTNNTSTSSGQLAFYVERMARQGIIGIAMCNSPEFVAAAKGGKPVFGTNPLAVGIPQKGCVPFTVRYSS